MSAEYRIYLSCNTYGCTARYGYELNGRGTVARLRERAAAAGWWSNTASRPRLDYCPTHRRPGSRKIA
jgi:hypothetical protein